MRTTTTTTTTTTRAAAWTSRVIARGARRAPRRGGGAVRDGARDGAEGSTGDDDDDAQCGLREAKREVLRCVSGTRRVPRATTAKDVMRCVEAVESAARGVVAADERRRETSGASATTIFAPIDGDWTLVYSTKSTSGVGGGDEDSVLDGLGEVGEGVVDAITSALYATFFKFAPALAGSAETNQRGVRNTQFVDSNAGTVRNEVFVDAQVSWLPFAAPKTLRIGVEGELRIVGDARRAEVTFTSFDFGLISDDGFEPTLKLPLPRPRGSLDTTFCDETMRISRGGRGGVFILTRL